MKCTICKKGRMVAKVTTETVEIDGAPTFEIEGVQRLECDSCHDKLIDSISSRELTKKTLARLIEYYSSRQHKLPGKVAYWMRHAITLSQTKLAEKVGGISPSAFTHAAARNTMIDQYAAFVLLALCADFVTEKNEGQKLIEKTKKINKILGIAS